MPLVRVRPRTRACHLAEVTRHSANVRFVRPEGHPWDYHERCGAAPRTGGQGGGQAAAPWATAKGRACFQRWVDDTTHKLNGHRGSAAFDRRKPWRINRYGLFIGRSMASVAPPDDWGAADVNRDRFAWMWKHMTFEGRTWYFGRTYRDIGRGVPLIGLRYYVRHCMRNG